MQVETYSSAMTGFRLCFSKPWGDCMHWWFTVAEEMFMRGLPIPETWEYRQSPLGPQNDPDDYATQIVWGLPDGDLLRLGQVMTRYAGVIRRNCEGKTRDG